LAETGAGLFDFFDRGMRPNRQAILSLRTREDVMKGNRDKGEGEREEIRVELKYCERCGGLWVRERGATEVYCESCRDIMADLPAPKKKQGRVTLPVRAPSVVEEYSRDDGNDDSLDFEAAGGAA
jgi:hypothetical protein